MKRNFCFIIIVMLVLTTFFVSGCLFMKKNNSSKLCEMIEENKTEEALELIKKVNNINSFSHPKFLRGILNIMGTDIRIPLVCACEKGNYKIVEALLKKGADPNIYLNGNWSAIEATFKSSNDDRLEIAELLIEYGADVNLYGSGVSALFTEAMHFVNGVENELLSNQIVLFLLDNGAEKVDNKGNTILHYAAAGNSVLISQNLLKRYNFSINSISDCGKTPLIWAAEKGATDTIKLLLGQGADKNIADFSGNTAYDYAVQKGYVEVIEILKPERHKKTGDGSMS